MKKQNQISELPRLDREKYENIFNVYQTNEGYYYYNLLQTISFPQNLPESVFAIYTIKYEDTWPYVSFKAYQTPNLWWLILLANNIQNPTLPLVPGTDIKIPNSTVVEQVLKQIGK